MFVCLSPGCAVIPLGPAFSDGEVLGFLQKLQPTAILGMPSFVMTLADYVSQLRAECNHNGTEDVTKNIKISKVITGMISSCSFCFEVIYFLAFRW